MPKSVYAAASALALSAMVASVSCLAQEAPPAVSAPNMKVDMSGGFLGGGPAYLGSFTGTAPLGHSFGIQLDGALGVADDDPRGGFAGHVFYRDPRSYSVGVTGMWSRITGPWDSAKSNILRAGLEGEVYLGDFSILPAAGWQHSNADATGYASLGALYYVTPYLVLGVSTAASSNARSLQTGLEYQFDKDMPLSVILDVGIDNRGPAFALAGLRYSFGAPSKSLQQRDRFDDPANIVRYMNTVGAAAFTAGSAHNPPIVVKPSAPGPI
jgi:hypothetical protein